MSTIRLRNKDVFEDAYSSGLAAGGFALSEGAFSVKNQYVFFNDLEDMPTSVLTSGDNNGFFVSTADSLTIATDLSNGGTRSIKKEFFQHDDFPKIYLKCPDEHDRIYFSCYWRYETADLSTAAEWNSNATYSIGDSVQHNLIRYKSKVNNNVGVDPTTDYNHLSWDIMSNVWKMARVSNNHDDPYHATRWSWDMTGTLPTSPAPSLLSDQDGYTKWAEHNEVTDFDPLVDMVPNKWHFYEMWCYAGTVEGHDSTFEVRINNKPAVMVTGGNFRTTLSPDKIRSVLTPINGLDNQWQAGKSNTDMWMDEVYLTTSFARVVMTNNASYNASTKWAIQQDVSNKWNSDRIVCKLNRGSFNIGDEAWIHVINESNNVVYSKRVTVV